MRRDLRPTLLALDFAASDVESLELYADELPSLQYALHAVGEHALVPLLGEASTGGVAGSAFAELEYALTAAREETADVAEMLVEAGPAAAAPLLWEWRAALFGVRLALLRLERGGASEEPAAPPRFRFLPFLLLVGGVALVLGGALAETWQGWIAGLALVAASTALSPRP